ncbi:MAG: DUF5072 family protein [Raoultibacter sp.]
MLVRLGLTDLIAAIQSHIERKTAYRCFDHANNEQSPFYCAALIDMKPDNTKTMFVDVYTVGIHCIAAPSKSNVGVFALIKELEEAMTEEVSLTAPFHVVSQVGTGLMTLKEDETGEKHALLGFDIAVCYGLNVK